MTPARCISIGLFAALTLAGCAQQEGDVCQRYGTAGASDCDNGLECCGEARTCSGVRGRGICAPTGTCGDPTPLVCGDGGTADAGDAGDEDAGGVDAGGVDSGGVDAGSDAGTDSGTVDAGSDAGPPDAGFDAGAPDAGSDSGPPDGG